jgi:translation initiation factor IF-2
VGVRVHSLAKELNRSSKELMKILRSQGVEVKNHFSSVSEGLAAKLRIQFGGEDSIRKPEKGEAEPEVVEEKPEVTETPADPSPAPAEASDPEPAPVEAQVEPAAESPATPVAESDAEDTPPPAPAVADSPDSAESPPTATDETGGDDAAPVAEPTPEEAPPSKPATIEMAPGFGGAPPRPKTPVAPVARPMPAGGPTQRPRKARPLIIRSKPTSPPPARTGPGGPRPPGRGRPDGGPPRGPGGPGGPPRGGPPRGGFGGGGGAPGGGSRVRFFPGEIPPGGPPGGAPGRGGGRRQGGRRTKGRHAGGGGRGRQRESFEFFRRQRQEEVESGERPSELQVQLPVTLKELAPIIGVKHNFLLKAMMEEGVLVNVNTALTEEMLLMIGEKFSVLIEVEEAQKVDSSLSEIESKEDAEEDLLPRAPVVTILGHVDHGKTSLLDKIRETRVTQSESGGITQHISAYRVDHEDKHVVFIDTPGHKAFTEMRARGANITDVAVLVVAADDGPMPQTQEAMEHAQAAEVPIVVALNKIDRPNANPNRAKQKLAEMGIAPPDWGGNTELVEVSALQGTGIDDLLELLSLETEILNLRANPNKPAIGTVLEARATTGRGNVITVLVQEGTLRNGDVVICGPAWGKVRTLSSTVGFPLDSAGPSTPVEITGLSDMPSAGDRFYALEDQQKAREIAEDRQRKQRAAERMVRTHVTLEGLHDHIAQGKTKEIKLVIKTDVTGTLEVLKKELSDLRTREVAIRVLRGGVGEITEDDILLADASDAIVIGFHVSANQRTRSLADEKGVEIRTYEIIYNVIEEMRLALEGMLEPEVFEELQGKAEILQLFKSSRLGNIAGCMVRDGLITRDDPIRLVRDGVLLHEGRLDSLKRVKEDVKEVREGFECGMRVQGFSEIQIGDVIESYKRREKKRKLEDIESKEAAEAREKEKEEATTEAEGS